MTSLSRDQLDGCTTLFPGTEPSGVDLRYDDAFERLKQEIAKLTLPEAGVQVDWVGVRKGCLDILTTRSKDLTVAAYLAVALLVTDGLPGLAAGLEVLNTLTERAWEQAFPPAARPRQRKTLFVWLLERLALMLRTGGVSVGQDVGPVVAQVERMQALLQSRMSDSDLNFPTLLAELAPRRTARPALTLDGSFTLASSRTEPDRWEVTPAARPEPLAARAGAAVATWLDQLRRPSSPDATAGLPRTAFVLPLGAAGGEAALGVLWRRGSDPEPGAVDHWASAVEAATPLEALDLLDRMVERIPPGEVELPTDADLTHDLTWGLREVSLEQFARSIYLEERAVLWPRLVAYLAGHRDNLAARLPASDLLTRMVWQQLLSRRHHPAVLQAKIWTALWRRLGGLGPLAVLIPLSEPWEVTLVSRALGAEDGALLLPPGDSRTAAADLRHPAPTVELPADHLARDPGVSLGELLAG